MEVIIIVFSLLFSAVAVSYFSYYLGNADGYKDGFIDGRTDMLKFKKDDMKFICGNRLNTEQIETIEIKLRNINQWLTVIKSHSSLDSKYGTDMTPFNHIYKSVDEIYEIIKDY
jgi:hypothetical protein